VWRPETWEERNSLLDVAEENSVLGLKRDGPGEPTEVAQDLASMPANGGVLLYGIEEARQQGAAIAVRSFPIKGAEERVRLIAGTSN
jgi:hypothetical protein